MSAAPSRQSLPSDASQWASLAEVVVFAVGWSLLVWTGVAELSLEAPTFADFVYFSGVVYTTLGFGDIVPVGGARILTVAEAVTGLVLIAWTASFTYFEMRENWSLDGEGEQPDRRRRSPWA